MSEDEFNTIFAHTGEGLRSEWGHYRGRARIKCAHNFIALYDAEGKFIGVWQAQHQAHLSQIRTAVTSMGRVPSDVVSYLSSIARSLTFRVDFVETENVGQEIRLADLVDWEFKSIAVKDDPLTAGIVLRAPYGERWKRLAEVTVWFMDGPGEDAQPGRVLLVNEYVEAVEPLEDWIGMHVWWYEDPAESPGGACSLMFRRDDEPVTHVYFCNANGDITPAGYPRIEINENWKQRGGNHAI